MTSKEITINMGPQHPSTHGVLRLILELDGEVVVSCTPHIGYLHRGSEKLAENKTFQQIVPLTDRFDYLSCGNNNLAYAIAVEKLMGIEVPERADYLRTLVAELSRISAHLLWLATHAADIGAVTVLLYCLREREEILNLFELLTGARLTVSYVNIGGVRRDASPEFFKRTMDFMDQMPGRIEEYNTLIMQNRIWLGRTKDIGVIPYEEAIDWGLTGGSLRGSGVDYDIRKAIPYSAYDRVKFEVPLGVKGDVYDRYIVRMEEMSQSVRIVKQCIQQMPDGPYKADIPTVVLPPKDRVSADIETLIHHFVLVSKGFEVRKGEVYVAAEVPKGELGFYIVSDGGTKPLRMKVRSPSFVNLQCLPRMVEGHMIADIVSCIGSIDIVLGEVDR
ncbi:MAG: NADH dehydrogenase (quinone) subunit D [Nitrospirota bacterium]